MKMSRNQDITYTKAVGIMLMVLGHAIMEIDNWHVTSVIVMFHMPLFFFFSGYCLKMEYFEKPHMFVWKRVRGIYWPYVKWSLVFLLLHNVFFALNVYNNEYGHNGIGLLPYTVDDLFERLAAIVFTMRRHEMLLEGYWFMRELLRGSLMAFGLLWVLYMISHRLKISYNYNLMIGGVFC